MYALARRYGFHPPHWYEPNVPLMAAGLVMLILAVVGARAAFALPVALKANWIFRMTDVQSPKAYFAAIRRAMFTLIAAPVWIVASIFYLSVWGGPEAVGHVLVMLCVGVVVVEWSLTGFRKMPFACSYVPGASNLRIKLPIYGAVFLGAVDIGTRAERSTFEEGARTALLGVILLALVFHARRRWRKFANGPSEQIQFDEKPIADVAPLDLSHDGVYSRYYRYIDVIHAPPEPAFHQRAFRFLRKAALVTAGFCAVGFAYEQIAEWRHPLPPRQGRIDRHRWPLAQLFVHRKRVAHGGFRERWRRRRDVLDAVSARGRELYAGLLVRSGGSRLERSGALSASCQRDRGRSASPARQSG